MEIRTHIEGETRQVAAVGAGLPGFVLKETNQKVELNSDFEIPWSVLEAQAQTDLISDKYDRDIQEAFAGQGFFFQPFG